jgi:hypothetical protein
MDIKQIFNIILLALSLTTILITVISFIIYKIRQVITNNLKGNKHNLDGLYLRRFSPKLKEINKREQDIKKSKVKISIKMKFGASALLLFVIISSVLLFENYFLFRKELRDRHTSASTYRELIKTGLLKTFSYDPYKSVTSLNLVKSKKSIEQVKYLDSKLKGKKYCLLSTWRATKFNDYMHLKAMKHWKSFLSRNNYKYKIKKTLVDEKCTWIIPHVTSFSVREKLVLKVILNNHPVIISGGVATLDGLGNRLQNHEIKSIFPFEFYEAKENNATMFVREVNLNWELPSGLLIDWPIIDKRFSSFKTTQKQDSLISNYKGNLKTVLDDGNINYFSRLYISDKYTWTSLDPMYKVTNEFSDLIIKNIIAKAQKVKVLGVSHFPKGHESASSFIIRYDDTLYPFSNAIDLFQDSSIMLTFFTQPRAFEKLQKNIDDDYAIEVGIINESADQVKSLSRKENFLFVEKHRLLLEEISMLPISGMMSFDESVDQNFIEAASLNKLKYFYGGRKHVAYSPVFVDHLNTLYIPRVNTDGESLLKDKSLVSVDDFLKVFKKERARAQYLNGLYTFAFSNGFVKSVIAREALEEFIKNEADTLTLAQVSKWELTRQNIAVNYRVTGKGCLGTVHNKNNFPVNNFVVTIAGIKKLKKYRVQRIKANGSYEICL